MKHLRPYQIFESQKTKHPGFPETEEEIHRLCKKYNITGYTINDDLSIDVRLHVELDEWALKYLPLNFNYVGADFSCLYNGLMSLKGSPNKVGGGFYCYYNKLTSLEGAPVEVGGHFDCGDNELESLEHCPKIIGGSIGVYSNKIDSLKGCPDIINYWIDCSGNNLMSLDYLPRGIDYSDSETKFNDNPIYSLINIFIKKNKVEDLIFEFNDYSIVRGDKVILDRLRAFIRDFNLDMPDLDKIKEYYTIV